MVTLRPYQEKCVAAMNAAAERGVTRQLVICATGLGKSQIFASFALGRGGNVFSIAHREELVNQMKRTFLANDPDVPIGIEKADLRSSHSTDRVIVASIQTVGRDNASRLKACVPETWPRTVAVDEVHHAAKDSYLKVLDYFGLYGVEPPNRSIVSIGLTATPARLDNLGYDKIFDDVVFRYGLREAIKDGWLVDVKAWTIRSGVDLSSVPVRNGDYVQEALDQVLNTPEHNREVARVWADRSSTDLLRKRRSLFFCITKNHARAVAEALGQVGAKVAVVVDDTAPEDRVAAIAGLKAGELDAIVNVAVMTEGVDIPELDTIHIVRPTKSQALYCQAIGRGTRKAPGKDHLEVYDYVGHDHDICSVGRIFGLPDAWDFQGQSVLGDVLELEDAVDDLNVATDGLTGMADLKMKLRSRTHRVQLIKGSLVSADIPSSLTWIQPSRSTERFIISWRNETREQVDRLPFEYQLQSTEAMEAANLFGVDERVEVFRNELGRYEGKIIRRLEGLAATHPMGSDASLSKLIGRIEEWIEKKRPHKLGLLDKKARWGRNPASEKQKEILVKRGVPKDFLDDSKITKREASIMLGIPGPRIRQMFVEKAS